MLLRFSTILIRIKTSAEIQLFFTLIFYYLTKSDKIQLLRIHKYNKNAAVKQKSLRFMYFQKQLYFLNLKKLCRNVPATAHCYIALSKKVCAVFFCVINKSPSQ